MANNIRGITVEIGGDTTKLGKALQDVEKQGRNLSKELADINKLLKLDPGNAELLAQKQKVLAEAVETTRNKLDTLKTAEKQVQDQFARGEVSEDQVRALQREIIETTNKLESYERASRETAEQIDKVGDHSEDASKDVDKLGDKAKETGEKLEDAGDKATSFGETVKKAGSVAAAGLTALGTAAGAAVGSLAGATVSAASYADDILTMSTVTGVATDDLQAFSYASELVDVSVETLTKSMAKNIKSMTSASDGSKAYVEAYKQLGVEVKDANGNLRDGETVYWECIDALGKIENETERDAIAMQLFGKSAQELNPLIEAGSEKINELTQEAREVGAVLSEDALDALGSFDDSIQRLKGSAEASKNALGSVLLPELQLVTDAGAGLLGEFTKNLNASGGGLEGLTATLEGMSGDIVNTVSDLLGQLLSSVSDVLPTVASLGVNLVTSLVTLLTSNMPKIVDTGMDIIIALIDGITSAIPQITTAIVDAIPRLVETLTSAIPQFIQAAVDLVLAVADAIPRIIPPLIDALPTIILAIIDGLLSAIPQLLDGAIQFLTAIIDAIPLMIEALIPQIPTIVTTVIDGLIACIPQLVDGALKLLDAIIQAIPLIIQALIPKIPSIVDSIVVGLLDAFPVLLDGTIQLLMALVQAIPTICVELVKAAPQFITAILQGLAQLPKKLIEVFTKAWDGIKNAWSKVGEFFSNIWKGIQNAFGAVADWFRNVFSKAWQAVKDVFSTGGKIFDGIKDGIVTAFKAVVNAIIRGINKVIAFPLEGLNGILDTIQGISFLGISPFSWLTWRIPIPQIPELAQGGVLKKGQVGLLEGDGAEAVVPLEKNTEWIREVAKKFNNFLPSAPNVTTDALSDKLDKIYDRLGRLQIVLDGDVLVGETVDRMDAALANNQVLKARGV